MATKARLVSVVFLRAGIAAGLVGAALYALYNIVGILLAIGRVTDFQMRFPDALKVYFDFVFMVAAGRHAATKVTPSPALGFLLLTAVSLAWSLGFAFLAQTRRELIDRPLLSGIGFGFVVWVVMLVVLAVSGFLQPPNPNRIVFAILGDVVFFGIPVAYTVARMVRMRG